MTSLLQVEDVSKAFPGVQALSAVSLDLEAGEIVAVLGENGAGKSTLMKILAGIQRPDSGVISVDGATVTIDTPRRANELGIALIHQELLLCDNLTVEEWISLGREPRRGPFIVRDGVRARARGVLDRLGAEISVTTRLDRLPIGQRQVVEIARALSVGARVLIMDEPTSALSTEESDRLFEVVRDLRSQGVGVLYISHRLAEIERLADRAVVLRDGKLVGELPREDISHERMVTMMVGRDVDRFYHRTAGTPGDVVMDVQGLRTRRYPAIESSFQVRRGEIVGIAGLVGAGRSELLETLAGVVPAAGGGARVAGVSPLGSVPRAVAAGVALVPEDRKNQGLVLRSTVEENIALPSLAHWATGGIWRQHAREREAAHEMGQRLSIRPAGVDRLAGTLSGGNQQKVVLGKWLEVDLSILLLDEPTRGIDIGSKAEIYGLIEELTADGLGVLFASSEIEEILGLADRVLVMHEGRIAGQLSRAEASDERIMMLATGRAT